MSINKKRVGSDRDRMSTLDKAEARALADQEQSKETLSSEIRDRVFDLAGPFAAQTSELAKAYSLRRKLVEVVRDQTAEVSLCVRHGWTSLENFRERRHLDGGFMEHYRLPGDGGRPKVVGPDRWVQVGKGMVKGDAEAAAAGYPTMQNPSAAELAEFLDGLKEAILAADQADHAYQMVQKTSQAMRERVDALIQDMSEYLRFVFINETASARRRQMRKFGFRFVGVGAAEEDAEDGEEVESIGLEAAAAAQASGVQLV